MQLCCDKENMNLISNHVRDKPCDSRQKIKNKNVKYNLKCCINNPLRCLIFSLGHALNYISNKKIIDLPAPLAQTTVILKVTLQQ